MNAPTLSLVVRTPIRLIATMSAADDAATQATWQISTASNFASTVVDSTATSGWATVEYAIPSGQETTTYYVRAKVSDGSTESSWSATLTVTAATTPSTPTIAQLGATPQRIGVYVSNLTADNAGVFQFQFSKSNTFATVLADVTGGTRAEYLVPSADRRTTHYVRARAGNLQDIDSGGSEVYSWSSWSSTLTVSGGAGQVGDDDIASVAIGKVTGRGAIGVQPFDGLYDPTNVYPSVPKNTHISTTNFEDSNLVSDVVGNQTTYRFHITAAIAYNAQTDLKFKLVAPNSEMYGATYILRYGSGSLTSSAATASSPTTTFYYGDIHTPPTITVTQSGSSTASEYITFIQFDGTFTAWDAGTFGLAFAANTTPTGKYPTLVTGQVIVEEVFSEPVFS